jgi:hypothetical protein
MHQKWGFSVGLAAQERLTLTSPLPLHMFLLNYGHETDLEKQH